MPLKYRTGALPQQEDISARTSPPSDANAAAAVVAQGGQAVRRSRWLILWGGMSGAFNLVTAVAAGLLFTAPGLAAAAILFLAGLSAAVAALAVWIRRHPPGRERLWFWRLGICIGALLALGSWLAWASAVVAEPGGQWPQLLLAGVGTLMLLVPFVHWPLGAVVLLLAAVPGWWWLLGGASDPAGAALLPAALGLAAGLVWFFAGSRASEWTARLVDAEAAARVVAGALRRDLQHSEQRAGLETEHRRAVEQELTMARDAAEGAMRAKTEFLATMSHEIRTPLNGILPILELLRDTPLDHEQRDYLDTAYKSSRHLLRLINDVLDFAKVESGKLELENIEVDLRELVESVADLMRRAAESKGLELTVNLDTEVPAAVRGDPIRLRQVLTNLVSNAVKFTDQGSVRIEVRRQRLDRKHVDLLFAVVDTGLGMSQETARRLFQSFTQADASTTRKHGGTGLGLAISKRLVELMGGRIGVRTTLGKGCTFWFLLPMRRSLHDVPSVRRDLRGVRVLTLVKHPVERERIGEMLQSWEILEERAQSTVAAISKLRSIAMLGESWAFDLLLVDTRGYDQGIQALVEEVRSERGLAGLQIMLVIAPGSPLEKLREHADVAIVRAPLQREQLKTELHRVLDVADSAWETLTQPHTDEAAAWEPALMAPEVAFGTNPRPARVLLVEDNPINLAVARRLLERLEMECGVATDGHEALLRLEREGPFDVVLMDVQMPGMDGYETTRKIRELETPGNEEQGRHIPIIAMTANAMQGDRERCLDAGMDDYLPKPIDLATLRTTLVRWLAPADEGAAPAAAEASDAAAPRSPWARPAAPRRSAAPGTTPLLADVLHDHRDADHPAIVDAAVITELREIMEGDFVHLIQSYLEHAPTQIAQLEEAARAGDIEAMVRPAHSLKSSSANVGASQVSQVAREIETDARESRRTAAAAALPVLREAFDRAGVELNRLIAAATAPQ